jgi:ligand-binding sensor domain-containing protein
MGVTRIDAISASLMNLTTADGLPSASVRSIVILSDGTKLIGTDSGLARYTGP